MYQNKPNLCFICCYINSCSSINISSKNSNVRVVVYFLSQVIFIFFCSNFISSIHYHTQKEKENKTYLT